MQKRRLQALEASRAGDVEGLVLLARGEGGLMDDAIRRLAWPVLLLGRAWRPDGSNRVAARLDAERYLEEVAGMPPMSSGRLPRPLPVEQWDDPAVLNRSVEGTTRSLPDLLANYTRDGGKEDADDNTVTAGHHGKKHGPQMIIPVIFSHEDADQVRKDVARSLWAVSPKGCSRGVKRQQLLRILLALLHKQPTLHYYQGLHDVVSVFLMVTDDVVTTFLMAERLGLWHLQFAMETSLLSTQHILALLPPLIHRIDPELGVYFQESEVEPIFALAWVLTWFSHSFGSAQAAARLFDVFLCSHPLFPLYLAAAIVQGEKQHLLANIPCDMPSVHSYLTKLSLEKLVLEDVIAHALAMFETFPPEPSARGSDVLPYQWMHGSMMAHHTALSLIPAVAIAQARKTLQSKHILAIIFTVLLSVFVLFRLHRLLETSLPTLPFS